jgi:hypothetical protein
MLVIMNSGNSTGAHFDDAFGKNGGVLSVMSDVDHRQMESVP